MRRIITWPLILRFGISSFIGLTLCGLIDYVAFGGKEEFSQTAVGGPLVYVFAFVWIVTILLFIPIRVFFDRKEVREMFNGTCSMQIMAAYPNGFTCRS